MIIHRQIPGILSATLFVMAFPIGILTEIGVPTFYVTVPSVILMQLMLLNIYRNTQSIILLSLYIFFYFIYLIPYFFWGIRLSQYTKYQDLRIYCIIAFLFYLFYLGALMAYRYNVKDTSTRIFDGLNINTSGVRRIIFIIFFVLVYIVSLRQGQNVLSEDAGSYELYKENLDNVNGIPLYTNLLLIFLYFIFRGKKTYTLLFCMIIAGFSVFCITRGLRIVLAPLCFLLFLLYIEGKIKNKWLYVLMFVGYFIFILANILKMNLEMQLKMLFSESDDDYILSHHAEILYGAAAGIGIIKDGLVSIFQRFILNITFLLEIIVPPSWFPDNYKFPQIITSTTTIGGGGLCILASFYMWGYIGVLLLGFYLFKFICISYKSKNTIRVLLCIIVMVFSPRWISYDFNNLIRFPFIGFLIYILFWKKRNYYGKR